MGFIKTVHSQQRPEPFTNIPSMMRRGCIRSNGWTCLRPPVRSQWWWCRWPHEPFMLTSARLQLARFSLRPTSPSR